MDVISRDFALFCTGIALVYYILPKRWRVNVLLVASYGFYATWDWRFPLILLALTVGNFWLAAFLSRLQKPRKMYVLWGAIALNISVLGLLKYLNFFIPALDDLALSLLFPIGLSYTVLELVAYQMGVSRRQIKPRTNFIEFATYLAYFPKLVAGPIERFKTFLPQLTNPKPLTVELMAKSAGLIIIGLFRKVVLSQFLFIIIPADILTSPQNYSAADLYFWSFAAIFYVYNDFAGYTNIVRGVSGFFGIELSANFKTPLFSRNFSEIWFRWHITLSNWLRDYVYMPTSRSLLKRLKNPKHPVILVVPTLLTMFVSALWHNVAWGVIVWGLVLGILQLPGNIKKALGMKIIPPEQQPLWRKVSDVVLVVAISVLIYIPFAATLPNTLIAWQRIVTAEWHLPDMRMFVIIVPSLILDAFQFRQGEFGYLRWPRLVSSFVFAFLLLFILGTLFLDLDLQPFVYQEF